MKRANLSVRSGRPSFSPSRSAVAALAALALLVPVQSAAHASALATEPVPVPSIVGLPPVASTSDMMAEPLPKKNGTVKVDVSQKTRTGGGASAGPDATLRAEATALAEAVTAATAKVALRALVVAVDSSDFGVDTWRATLDRVGAAYDVLYTATTPLDSQSLIRPDGTGRYNAILLTNSMLLYSDGSGALVSGLSADEWNLLWAYERDYGVRQATLYSSYGTWPEDYCLRGRTEGTVGDTALRAGVDRQRRRAPRLSEARPRRSRSCSPTCTGPSSPPGATAGLS